ncbi:DsrE family protein [Pontiellaceae bacterium B1224]|nr:DsrE family protein [Pontiellaceae bacterium B1224]
MKLKRSGLWIVVVSLGILTGACTCRTTGETRDGAFIHISHGTDDAHRVLMALQMADLMSADHDVLVYFDIKGIEVVLNDAEDISFSHFPTSKTQLASLPQKGVTLMACPGCLKAAGKTPADLADGVEVADKAKFFSFTQGRILTLDY